MLINSTILLNKSKQYQNTILIIFQYLRHRHWPYFNPMNENLDDQHKVDEKIDRNSSCSIHTGSLLSSNDNEASKRPSTSVLPSNTNDQTKLANQETDLTKIEEQERKSESLCSQANSIPFSTHSDIELESENKGSPTNRITPSNAILQPDTQVRRSQLQQERITRYQTDNQLQNLSHQKLLQDSVEDKKPVIENVTQELAAEAPALQSMNESEHNQQSQASPTQKRKKSMFGKFKVFKKKANNNRSESAPNVQGQDASANDKKKEKKSAKRAKTQKKVKVNTSKMSNKENDPKEFSHKTLRYSSGNSQSKLQHQMSGKKTDFTTLQEIQEEQSSGIEPGSFHQRQENLHIREVNKQIQKHYRQEPMSPQLNRKAIRRRQTVTFMEREQQIKNSLQQHFQQFQIKDQLKQRFSNDMDIRRKRMTKAEKKKLMQDRRESMRSRGAIQQIMNHQPIDLHQSLKRIKCQLDDQCQTPNSPHKHHHEEQEVEQKDHLIEHREKYNDYKERFKLIDQAMQWDFNSITKEIRECPINCVKYNHQLDSNIQNFLQYESLISVSEDGKELIITNKVPRENPDFILEADPTLVKQKQEKFKMSVKRNRQKMKKTMKTTAKSLHQQEVDDDLKQQLKSYKQAMPDCIDSVSSSSTSVLEDSDDEDDSCCQEGNNPYIFSIEQEINRLKNQYTFKKSTASCDISDIRGIVFGGQASRFWLYRKHMLCLDYQTLKFDTNKKAKNKRTTLPFYAWQCVTLQLTGRMVDLVIKNEKSMDLFLRFLIMATNTLDGVRNSARGLINELFAQSCRKRAIEISKERNLDKCPTNFESIVPAKEKVQIRKKHRDLICRQTFYKYRLMRIRIKISYHAFQNRETVNEMFLKQILTSYELLHKSGSIKPVANYSKKLLDSFDDILTGDISQCLTKLLRMNQDPVVFERKQMLYRRRELRMLGYASIEEMPNETYQKAMRKLLQKNLSLMLQFKLSKFSSSSPIGKSPIHGHEHGHGHDHQHNHMDLIDDCENDEQHKKHNIKNFGHAFGLFDNSKCADFFQNVKINGKPMYKARNAAAQLRFKFNNRVLNEELVKLRFILGVGGLNDLFFIKTVLKKLEIIKKKFVLDLEQGQEVFIPRDLSCDLYPASFRYYDPIIQITNNMISKQSKIYYSFKTEFNLSKIKNSNWQREWMTKLGFLDSIDNKKVTLKLAVLNSKEQNELQYTETQHPIMLQKSRYILIDTTEESLKHWAYLQQEQMYDADKYQHSAILKDQFKSIEDKPLNYRFCHIDEVNQNQLNNISFKQAFYQHQDMLKNQGQKQFIIAKINAFIEDNIEEIYAYRPNAPKEAHLLQKSMKITDTVEPREIECIDERFRTPRQRAILFREQRIYANKLLEDQTRAITNKYISKRIQMLTETARDCDRKVDFNTKNDFLEERIEFTQRYFTYMNDLNHKNAQMQKIRKDLFRINRKLKRRKMLKQRQTDPHDVLKHFMMMEYDEHGELCLKRSKNMVRDTEKLLQDIKQKEKEELEDFRRSQQIKPGRKTVATAKSNQKIKLQK